MSVSDQELVGRVIADKYRLDKLVARGGFSSVFRGTHLGIDRDVAVKVLPLDDKVEATWIERFSREAKVISQLTHPNTITIFDFGQVSGEFFYLVMEYVRGRSLSRYVKKFGPVSPDKAARFAIQIARALDEAHHQGIVHRDLKPSNIMVSVASSGEESIKVLDFGVAKLLDPVPDVDIQLTQVGAFVGTPRYASPEQLRREQLDHRSDIYGLGMIMWEILTGQPAVEPTDYGGCIQYHLGPEPWGLPPGFDVPDGLAEIVHKALEKDRANRYISCGQMADVLEEFIGNYHYGQTDRLSTERITLLQEVSGASLSGEISEAMLSRDSAAEMAQDPPDSDMWETRQRNALKEIPSDQRETSRHEPVQDDFFGDLAATTDASDSYDDISEVFDFEDDGRDEPSLDEDLFAPSDSYGPDNSNAELLDSPAVEPSGWWEGENNRKPKVHPPGRFEREQREKRRDAAAQSAWDPDLDDSPLAEDPRAKPKPVPATRSAERDRRDSSPRDRRPAPAQSRGGIPQSAVTKIIGGAVFVILIVVASIVLVNVMPDSAADNSAAEPNYMEDAEKEVAALLETADEPKAAKSDGTPTISAKAIFIALNHDNWRVGEQTTNDLGDLKQVSAMIRKEEMAASVTVYSTRSVNIAEELLAGTKSPAEGITFGSTMVRVSPGPSSAKSGVTPVIAYLYQFKSIAREEAGK